MANQQETLGKDRDPTTLRYEALHLVDFNIVTVASGAISTGASAVQTAMCLPFNLKIMSVSLTSSGTIVGTGGSLNIVLGAATGTYAQAGSDPRQAGTIPPTVATASQSLFTADQTVATGAAWSTQTFYPTGGNGFDIIWPINGLLTFRANAPNGAWTGAIVTLGVKAYDVYFLNPNLVPWTPGSTTL